MTISDIAQRLNLQAGCPHLPPLILMTDTDRLPDPVAAVDQLPAGSAIILRHHDAPNRRELAVALRIRCRRNQVRLIVADDPGLAIDVDADGLHLTEHQARHPRSGLMTWRRYGRGLLTVAAHSPAALCRADNLAADAALLSAVYPTASHPGRPPIGLTRFTHWCRQATLPVFALGGINGLNGQTLVNSGAAGIAGIAGLTA